MEEQKGLRYLGVDFYHVDFDAQFLDQEEKQRASLDLNIGGKIEFHKSEGLDEGQIPFSVLIETKVYAEDHLTLVVRARGKFMIAGEFTDVQRNALIYQNAPAIMFPYVRAFISNFTNNCGDIIFPIQLPTMKVDLSNSKAEQKPATEEDID